MSENKMLKKFLKDISIWMIENDYELGNDGSKIFDRICKVIENE